MSKFEGGVILGLSTSQVSGDDLAGFNKAIVFGGFTNRILSRETAQLEIVYIQKEVEIDMINEELTITNHILI